MLNVGRLHLNDVDIMLLNAVSSLTSFCTSRFSTAPCKAILANSGTAVADDKSVRTRVSSCASDRVTISGHLSVFRTS